jgi:hypothetical protein
MDASTRWTGPLVSRAGAMAEALGHPIDALVLLILRDYHNTDDWNWHN